MPGEGSKVRHVARVYPLAQNQVDAPLPRLVALLDVLYTQCVNSGYVHQRAGGYDAPVRVTKYHVYTTFKTAGTVPKLFITHALPTKAT